MSASIIMSFGQYNGQNIQDVPTGYLAFIVRSFDKAFWLTAARDELLRRGDARPAVNGLPVKDLNTPGLPDRFTELAVWEKGRGNVSSLVILATPPYSLGPVEIPPMEEVEIRAKHAPNLVSHFSAQKEELDKPDVHGIVRRMGKLGSPIVVSPELIAQVGLIFTVEVQLLGGDLKKAATSLVNEAAIYGQPGEVNWLVPKQHCEVEVKYLERSWIFDLDQGHFPKLVGIHEISSSHSESVSP